MKKKIFIAAAVMISSYAEAQEQKNSSDSVKNMESVVVTANKIEQKQNETGKVLTVISQQELQRNSGKTLGEILNQQVGVIIGGANGPLGTVQTIYTRGSAAANTLILLDGIPLYDDSGISSEFDLNSFASDHIERIEILKGAQSSLYGSDAVAGVINIITKKPATGSRNINMNLSAGSYNTYRGSVNISGSGKKGFEYFAGYSKIYSDGFSSAYDSTGNNNYDDDGFKQDALSASIGFTPVTDLSFKLYGKYNLNKAQIDAGAFADDKDYTYQTSNVNAGLNVKYKLKKLDLFFNYNINNYERKYINDSSDKDPSSYFNYFIDEKYKGKSHFVELYSKINLTPKLNLVAGIDHRRNSTSQEYLYISIFGPFIPQPLSDDSTNTSQSAVYTSVMFNNHHGLTIGAGFRYNDHSVYGSNTTYSFNPAYTIKNVKVFANISSGYRVPSLYQLYGPYGNKALKPEQTDSYEAGVQYANKRITARVVGFIRNVRDVFAFYSIPDPPYGFYINDDQQKDRGIELETFLTFSEKLSLSANYTYVQGELETKNATGKDTVISNLYRRPKNVFNAGLTFTPDKKLLIRTQIRSVSSLYEGKFMAAPVKLDGYYLLDLYADYRFSKLIKVFVDLKNITDQEYHDQEGFSTRGFNFTTGLSLSL